MTAQEFIERMVGTPWVKWRADFDGADCFGMLILYHRHVLGIELGEVPHVSIDDGFRAVTGWEECTEGATSFMCFNGPQAVHCGILLPNGGALHCEGSDEHPGNVRVSRLRSMKIIYGDIKTFRYVGHLRGRDGHSPA